MPSKSTNRLLQINNKARLCHPGFMKAVKTLPLLMLSLILVIYTYIYTYAFIIYLYVCRGLYGKLIPYLHKQWFIKCVPVICILPLLIPPTLHSPFPLPWFLVKVGSKGETNFKVTLLCEKHLTNRILKTEFSSRTYSFIMTVHPRLTIQTDNVRKVKVCINTCICHVDKVFK